MGATYAKSAPNNQNKAFVDSQMKQEYKVKVNPVDIKAKVEFVNIDGLQRTKDDVVIKTIRELFKSTNFQEVVYHSQIVKRKFEKLGLFQNVGIVLDSSKKPDASPESVDVTFFVVENRRFVGGINTMVGNNEGSLVITTKLPNIFGRGEMLQTEYQHGTKHSSGFNLNYAKPLLIWGNPRFTTTFFEQGADFPWSGFKQMEKGAMAEITFNSKPTLSHTFKWEGIWRELAQSSGSAGFPIREDFGHSFKSALKHIITYDNRDASIFPSTGSYLKFQQEVSGLGGNVNMIKHELDYQCNFPMPFNTVLQATFSAGNLNGWGPEKSYNISDCFFLGGPLSIRGFQMRGVGPHCQGFALGATNYWATGLHLYSPLPFLPKGKGISNLFRLHSFLNAGNIGNFSLGEDYHHYFNSLITKTRFSYGAGLALSIGDVARFELNYVFPLYHQPGDKLNLGLQFGIGISYT